MCACIASGESAQQLGPAVTVTQVHGVPTFTVEGNPFLPPAFETYIPEERYFRQFAEAGTPLFSFNTNVTACDYGHSLPTHISVDVWDYAQFDDLMRRVLAANPQAMVMPRVNMGTPRWWLDAHPDALEQLEDGSVLFDPADVGVTLPKERAYPSLASPVWRQYQADALRKFIDHVQTSGLGAHIFGYMIVGLHTEEWYHWSAGTKACAGYSPPSLAAYRQWLKEKYRTDRALRKAWGSEQVTIETAQPPSCDARKDTGAGTFRAMPASMTVVDFLTFWNELIPDTIDYFARVAKEATGHRKAIGAFYGYQYEFNGDPEFGHNALGKYLASDALDYLLVTASYYDREVAVGADYQRSPAYSVQLHNKVWYHDNDTISFLAPKIHGLDQPGRENDPYWGQLRLLGYTPTAEQSRWMFRRTIGFSLANGMYASFFDLHGGYFNDPELMQEIGQLTRLSKALATEDRSSIAEILVVADEDSCAYITHKNPILALSLQAPQVALAQLGAPVDHVLLEDLDKVDAWRYKLVIFLNAYNVTREERRTIDRRLKRDGKWLMWCYAPGYFEDNNQSTSNIEALTGISIAPAEDTPHPLWSKIEDVEAPLALALRKQLPDTFGPDAAGVAAMHVVDHAATPLARNPESGQINLAIKHQESWTALYAISPDLPPAFYRELARQAGVHLYNEHDDTLYVNASLMTLHARDDGERTLHFPKPVTLHDALSEESLAEHASQLTLSMRKGETRMIRISTP
jgi:hypothetical protein